MFMTYKLLKDFAAKRGYKLINKEYKNEIELRNDDKIITIHTDDYGYVTATQNVKDDVLVRAAMSYSLLPIAYKEKK